NFKLASGTFVSVGELRIGAIGAIGDAVTDAVVCGEGRENVGLMFYPRPGVPAADIEAAVRAGVERFNAQAKGSGGRIARALVLDSPPSADAGEITDKGYIAQSLARAMRAADVERLFAEPAPAGVMAFSA
ncbi:MAG TPA: feruloyl-CoA synthase, partial [Phenylobacterium sp.]|nr:feruloyl-CoA synthase [Phenylobacterium sp.]